jgi:iron(III) transport system ATP-binding protein
MVSVHLRGVTKAFGDKKAVDNATLDIPAGELFFLLGPSGCGKTTCLRILAGFYDPDEGDVLFDDRPMSAVPAHRRNTGMVFQNYALWPHLTVYENVEYGLNVRGVGRDEKRERVMRALGTVHMSEQAQMRPNQLSGGQQQRIALARALVIEPDVLLLDEPLSNLDAKLRLELRHEIRRIHQEVGITAIYVTHDQSEALSLADRLAVMNDGRIEQIGTPREVYTRPGNEFVAGFIGETNFIDGAVHAVDGQAVTVEAPVGIIAGHAAAGREALHAGQSVRCCVRPEALEVVDAEARAGRANQLAARVAQSIYLGETEEFVLQAGDLELKAVMHNPGQHGRRVGDTVGLAFDAEDVVVFAR